MTKTIDLTGMVFGRLTVIKRDYTKTDRTRWECRCECGKTTIILTKSLRNGHTKSCGCFHDECFIARAKTHGMSKTTEYIIWKGIKRRCLNPNDAAFCNYGGRGVTMYSGWVDSFESFFSHVGKKPTPKHTIDRINNNKGYEPGNVRWATRTVQANNKRSNTLVEFNNTVNTIANWSRITGISHLVIADRLNKMGWSIEDSLTIPVGSIKPKHIQNYIEFNGVTQSIADWSRQTGICFSTLRQRINVYGWSVEDALTKPLHCKQPPFRQKESLGG